MSETYTPEDFARTVKEEEIRLRELHPTVDDIPSCMSLFDDFLSYNSAHLYTSAFHVVLSAYTVSAELTIQIIVSLWRDGTLYATSQ